MILSNLNDYCFIFEPNILKVVCQNTSAPTKEVTLVSNGITLKRNCINSVCYFDMSVIFESYFNASNFALNYAANTADPFFKTCLFTISSPDETTQTDVSKKLRWGAYQFDEVSSNADFSFPFWVGMPLVLNSSKNHDSSIITGTESFDGTFSGIKTIPSDSFETFTHEVKLSGTKVQTITYNPQTCPTGHYLQWVDAHGKIWHFMFYQNAEFQNTSEIKAGEIVPYYPLSLTDSVFGRGKLIEKSKMRSFGCFQSVDEAIYPIVETILSSPIVKYWVNSKWIEVKIKDQTTKPARSGLVDILFDVELPNDYTQTR
jgi:hypothetical protein